VLCKQRVGLGEQGRRDERFVGVGGVHHHPRCERRPLDAVAEQEPVLVGQVEVHHDDVRSRQLGHGPELSRMRSLTDQLEIGRGVQDRPDARAHRGVIVHHGGPYQPRRRVRALCMHRGQRANDARKLHG
jgi:hypothetical protein